MQLPYVTSLPPETVYRQYIYHPHLGTAQSHLFRRNYGFHCIYIEIAPIHSILLRKWRIIYEHTKRALVPQIPCVMVTFNKQTCPFINKIILSHWVVNQPGIIAWSDVTLKVQSRLCVGPCTQEGNSWEQSEGTKKRTNSGTTGLTAGKQSQSLNSPLEISVICAQGVCSFFQTPQERHTETGTVLTR